MFQVQERLIKNKTLLTTIEPTISSTSPEVRYGIGWFLKLELVGFYKMY